MNRGSLSLSNCIYEKTVPRRSQTWILYATNLKSLRIARRNSYSCPPCRRRVAVKSQTCPYAASHCRRKVGEFSSVSPEFNSVEHERARPICSYLIPDIFPFSLARIHIEPETVYGFTTTIPGMIALRARITKRKIRGRMFENRENWDTLGFSL